MAGLEDRALVGPGLRHTADPPARPVIVAVDEVRMAGGRQHRHRRFDVVVAGCRALDVVAGDHEPPARPLDGVARSSGIPTPGGILDLAGDLARPLPALSFVATAGDPHRARRLALDDQVLRTVGEVLAEQQPDDAGFPVQHRRRVAVGVGAGAHDHPLRLPTPPAVEAAPQHQVDVAGVAAHHLRVAVPALADRQDCAAAGGEQRRRGVGAVASRPVLEQQRPLIHHFAIAQGSTRVSICRALPQLGSRTRRAATLTSVLRLSRIVDRGCRERN